MASNSEVKLNTRLSPNMYELLNCPLGRFIWIGKRFKLSSDPNKRNWRFCIRGLLFDRFSGLLSKDSWSGEYYCSDSWRAFTDGILNNVIMFMTPWYRPRRRLLNTFIDNNGGKLLNGNRKYAFMRNRKHDCCYYELECGFMSARVTRTRWVDEDGEGQCTFITGTKGLAKNREVIASGMCLTTGQCTKLLREIVERSPDLEWFF